MSLQRKIADLESKLNYGNPNESQQHPVNGGSGESGEIKIQSKLKRISPKGEDQNLNKYKQDLLKGMSNVVFDDNYDSMGMFAKEMVDSEVRPKLRNEVDNKVKINVDMVTFDK